MMILVFLIGWLANLMTCRLRRQQRAIERAGGMPSFPASAVHAGAPRREVQQLLGEVVAEAAQIPRSVLELLLADPVHRRGRGHVEAEKGPRS